MSPPRDSQRAKVYRADWSLSTKGLHLETVVDMQTYVDRIVSSRWWRNRYEVVEVVVKDGRRRRRAAGWSCREYEGKIGYIAMPKWSRYEIYVLHEVAHTVTPDKLAPHGREFARNFLSLVERWMGHEIGKELREAYRRIGVKWHRKRQLSDERRAQLSAHMKEIRRENKMD